MQPGSVRWLLRHELRLLYREQSRKLAGAFGLTVLLVVLHAAAIPLALGMSVMAQLGPSVPLLLVSGVIGITVLTLTARALTLSVQSMYERGDVDLLLSSPLPPATWFAVRAAAVAAVSGVELLLLLGPIADVFVIFGHGRWALAYAAIPLAALVCTSVALWLGIALLRTVGPRRMRLVAQLIAAVVGLSAAVLTQLPSLLWGGPEAFLGSSFLRTWLPEPDSAWWLPARIAMAETPWALLAPVFAVGAFAWSVRVLAAPFVAGLAATSGNVPKPLTRARARTRFPHAVAGARVEIGHGHAYGDDLARWRRLTPRWALVRKDLRVVLRDPWLMTQLLQENLLLLPATLLCLRFDLHGVSFAWLAVVTAAGTSSGVFAYLASSGEEAPELVGTAPLTKLDRRLAQLAASLVPVLACIVVLCAVLAVQHAYAAAVIGLCSSANALCNALVNLRNTRPLERRKRRQRRPIRLFSVVAELTLTAIWVGCSVLALTLG